MEEIKLDVQIRNEVGTRKIKGLRRDNFIPAIVYGGDKEPTSIKVERRPYEKIMRLYQGQSLVFHLNILENDKKLRGYSAVLKEEQLHPVSDQLIHLDFKRISLKEKIEVKVPVISKGEAIGVKRDKGSLDQVLRELDVVCLPTSIPKQIEINVESLEVGSAIHVKDIVLPDGVVTKHNSEAIVFSVVLSMQEEVDAEEKEEEPEVIKGKKDKAEEGKS